MTRKVLLEATACHQAHGDILFTRLNVSILLLESLVVLRLGCKLHYKIQEGKDLTV